MKHVNCGLKQESSKIITKFISSLLYHHKQGFIFLNISIFSLLFSNSYFHICICIPHIAYLYTTHICSHKKDNRIKTWKYFCKLLTFVHLISFDFCSNSLSFEGHMIFPFYAKNLKFRQFLRIAQVQQQISQDLERVSHPKEAGFLIHYSNIVSQPKATFLGWP